MTGDILPGARDEIGWPVGDRRRDEALGWGLVAAFALHLALGLTLLRLPAPSASHRSPEDGIAVEIVPAGDLGPMPGEPASVPEDQAAIPEAPPQALSPETSPPAPSRPSPPPMIRATTLLSSRNLDDPRSRGLRRALRQLDDDTRAEQLCDLEAMEQVHAWRGDFQPDRLVAYAMSEPIETDHLIEAKGAAFRSRSLWYRIAYRCELSPDRKTVAGFAFLVGDPVPRDEWRERGLPAIH